MMEFGQKRWISYDVLLIDPFPIEKHHKFTRIWILLQKKKKHGNENFQKKCHFGVRNDEIWPKNDEPPMKSCSLTHCNRKATQIKRTPLRKFSKRCLFRGWNDGICWQTMNLFWSPARWPISNWKAAQICANLNSDAKKKRPPKWKFSKKCHFRGRNDGIWLKTINHLWSPSRWPISNWKAVQICVNLKFGPKKLMELGEKWWTSYGVLLVDPFPIEKLHKFAWSEFRRKKKKTPNKKFSTKCHFGGWNDGNW